LSMELAKGETLSSSTQLWPANSTPAKDLKFPNVHADHGFFVDLSRGRTYAQLAGPADGIPVVLVHGLTGWSYVWDDLITSLHSLNKYRLLTYDLYARGCSDVPHVDCSVDLLVEQLREVVDLLLGPSTTFHLIGLSQGGAISATFTARFSARVKRLVLLVPGGTGDTDSAIKSIMPVFGVPLLGSALRWAFAQRILLSRSYDTTMGDLFVYPDKRPSIEQRQKLAEKSRWILTDKVGYIDALFYMFLEWPWATLFESWATIPSTLPVCAIWGDKDVMCPYRNAQNLLKSVSHTKLITLENFGHGFVLEDAELTFRKIHECINE